MTRSLEVLFWSLQLWRDITNWVWPHRSLGARTPAMALGLTDHVWSVWEYVTHPVHVDEFTREI